MSTSFEFLPRTSRRIREYRILPLVFIGLAAVFALGAFFLRGSAQRMQERFETESAAIEKRKLELVNEALALIPIEDPLPSLAKAIESHNKTLIGPRFSWTILLKTLESVIPEKAVLLSLTNPASGKPEFRPNDRNFLLSVVVADEDSANNFYRRLSSITTFQNLTFTPRDRKTWQGAEGTAIDITFRFVEGEVLP